MTRNCNAIWKVNVSLNFLLFFKFLNGIKFSQIGLIKKEIMLLQSEEMKYFLKFNKERNFIKESQSASIVQREGSDIC